MKKYTPLLLTMLVGILVWLSIWYVFAMGSMMSNGNMMSMDMNNMPMNQARMNDKTMDHSTMDHGNMDPMDMSMADMGKMLEGKSWDELDKAFLEWMIPHHQGAIDMAEYMVNAKHPELRELWKEIIVAQQAEINQMNIWLEEWNYKN